jgi:hypothetical protein
VLIRNNEHGWQLNDLPLHCVSAHLAHGEIIKLDGNCFSLELNPSVPGRINRTAIDSDGDQCDMSLFHGVFDACRRLNQPDDIR